MGAALPGDDAVFGDHQRQPAVDDGLAGQELPEVPDLLVPQLEGYRGGAEPPVPKEGQGAAVVYIEAEVAPELPAQAGGDRQMAQVAHGHGGDLRVGLQNGPELRFILRAEHPGQHGAEPGEGRIAGGVRLLQQLRREVEHLHPPGQRLGELLRAADGGGEGRRRGRRDGGGAGGLLPLPAHRRRGHLRGQALQGASPQGVDAAGGEHEPLLQLHSNLRDGKHGAAGFREPLAQLLRRKGPAAGLLRHGACDGEGPAGAACRQHGGDAPGDGDGELHRMEPVLPAVFIGPADLCEKLLRPAGVLRTHPEHGGALLPQIISLGEAVAVEGGQKLPLLLPGGAPALIQQAAVDARYQGHILRTLHPPLDLQAGSAHSGELRDLVRQAGILQAQRMLPPAGGAACAVGQPAGLGTAPSVAAALPHHGAQGALTGVAHAKGAVDEDLDLSGAAPDDGADVLPGELPGQHHPLHAQLGGLPGASQGKEGHLGAGVDGQIRRDLPGQGKNAPVLDQDGVDAHFGGPAQGRGGLGKLPVRDQGVQREIYLYPPQVAVVHRLLKLPVGKILCVFAGIEVAKAHIDGVRAGLHGGHQGVPRPGGCKKLRHPRRLFCCCSLKSWRLSSETSFLAAAASSR